MSRALAILNNMTWCRTVVAAHGVASEIREYAWVAEGRVPPYYSNLVTRTAAEGEAEQLACIRRFVAAPPKPDWSLKDSHARLDADTLEGLGLRLLFEARWFGLPPFADAPASFETGCRFEAVGDEDGLAPFESAWQRSSPAPGVRVFPPALLEDPDVTFLAAREGGALLGGAIANRSEGVIGLSNVFTVASPVPEAFLRDCARAVGALEGTRPVVGYGPAQELEALAPLGGVDLGGLRVWISGSA